LKIWFFEEKIYRLDWINLVLFKNDAMNERDDYQRFKDDPPIERRLLGYQQFALRVY